MTACARALSRRHLLLAACALASLRPRSALAQAAPAAGLRAPPPDPRSLLDLDIRDGAGEPVSLGRADLAGRVLVLNFWAPWCLPCRQEMPSLSRTAAALAGLPVAILPVSFDWRGAAGARAFYRETGITNLPVLLGDGENLKAATGLEYLPTTVVTDRAGTWIATVAGEATWDDPATLGWLSGLAGAQ